MAAFSLRSRRAEVDTSFSTPLLAVNPLLHVGSSEPPVLSNSNAADLSPPSHLLKGLWMNLHHSRGLDRIEQWLWNKSQ